MSPGGGVSVPAGTAAVGDDEAADDEAPVADAACGAGELPGPLLQALAAAVGPATIPGGPVSLTRQSSSQPVIGVYDTAGRRVAGSGPARSALAASGPRAQVRDAVEGGDLAVITPIPSDQKAVGTVR